MQHMACKSTEVEDLRMTYLTSPLSIPNPKAIVAQIQL